ncbi:MAG: N-acetylmuramoyl-L-alanine amidase [Pseudolabrys sp.]|nr:N-acetylmuramoyl-L-alanine amidase [Pseudolabrys sp.]
MSTLLKRGSKGAAVKDLQGLLNQAGASPALFVDGDFGGKTEKAVIAFQRRMGLVVDGKVGTQTRTALRMAIAPPAPARPEPDKSAMAQPLPAEPVTGAARAIAPPNVSALQLLDTARLINEIIVHCAATPEGKDFTVADIRSWHKQRGFSDVGYHYVVYRDGRIMLGRPVGQVGAHVAERNTGTIGVCYIGGLAADAKTAKDTRTPAQRGALLWLVKTLAKKHRGVKKISGHNQYAAKACPCFDVRKDPLGAIV